MNANTSIQRVRQVLARSREASVARGELVLDPQFARDLLAWKGDGPKPEGLCHIDLLIECCQALNLDMVCLPSAQVTNRESDVSINIGDIHRFRDADLFVFWVVDGAFQSVVHRHGLMAVLTMLASTPADLAVELKSVSDQVIASMEMGVAAGAHGIIIADDIAYNRNTYMAPDFIARHLLPVWKTQTAKAAELGVPVLFHSDGNLTKVLAYITSAGFDGLQGIEPAAGMDIIEISARYGQSLCLMGGIDPALLVYLRDRDHMKTACHHLRRAIIPVLTSAAADRGLIIGSCSGLYSGMSPELVHNMYALVSEFISGHALSS